MSKDQYVALSSYPPPPRHSNDSDDSLRALEISEGPATNPQRIGRCILLHFFHRNGGLKVFSKVADRIQLRDSNFNAIWYVYRCPTTSITETNFEICSYLSAQALLIQEI